MRALRILIFIASFSLGGCASTHHNPKDPFESFNRGVYEFNDAVDKAVFKPVAQGYSTVMPGPGKTMVNNFFSNLDDVLVTLNDVLQFKFVQAFSDGTRFWVNSTFGLFGLFNVADRLEKHNEDFGQTLGYWGINSGPYLVLPIMGSSSIRDGIGLVADSQASLITHIGNVPARNETIVAEGISYRAGVLDQEKVLDTAAIDRYAFIRDAYLQRRQSLVYDGSPPHEKFEDDDDVSATGKSSVNDRIKGSLHAAVKADTTGAPFVVASAAGSVSHQQPAVYRIWMTQREGIH